LGKRRFIGFSWAKRHDLGKKAFPMQKYAIKAKVKYITMELSCMVEKWFSKDLPESCSYCQWEIFPGSKVYVSADRLLFDRVDCIKSYVKEISSCPGASELLVDFGTPKEYVLANERNRHISKINSAMP
jgi:hypothetical protein